MGEEEGWGVADNGFFTSLRGIITYDISYLGEESLAGERTSLHVITFTLYHLTTHNHLHDPTTCTLIVVPSLQAT